MTEYADPDLETVAPLPPLPAPPTPEDTHPDRGPASTSTAAFVAALVVVSLVVGFGTATIVLNARDSGKPVVVAPTPTVPFTPGTGSTPGTTVPVPADPDANILGGLIVRQFDVAAGNTVELLNHGADLTVPTLDLCNGTYPSEALRTARRQVSLTDHAGTVKLGTEAVLYRAPAAGAQAFGELQSVTAKCPGTPVTSPVGESTVTTKFRKAPDGAWPRTPNVDRLAYDIVTTDANGQDSHSIAVYLRRGRVLMGVYFADPDAPQTAVAGKSTIAGIVGVFEARMAKVPASVAGG